MTQIGSAPPSCWFGRESESFDSELVLVPCSSFLVYDCKVGDLFLLPTLLLDARDFANRHAGDLHLNVTACRARVLSGIVTFKAIDEIRVFFLNLINLLPDIFFGGAFPLQLCLSILYFFLFCHDPLLFRPLLR